MQNDTTNKEPHLITSDSSDHEVHSVARHGSKSNKRLAHWLTHPRLRASLVAACSLSLLTTAAQALLPSGSYPVPLPSVSPKCANFSAAGGSGRISLSNGAKLSSVSGSFIYINSVTASTVYYSVAGNAGCERSGAIATTGGTVSIKQAAALAAPTGLRGDGICTPTLYWDLTPCAEVYHVVLYRWDEVASAWVKILDTQTTSTILQYVKPTSSADYGEGTLGQSSPYCPAAIYRVFVQAGDRLVNTCGTTTVWGSYSQVDVYCPSNCNPPPGQACL